MWPKLSWTSPPAISAPSENVIGDSGWSLSQTPRKAPSKHKPVTAHLGSRRVGYQHIRTRRYPHGTHMNKTPLCLARYTLEHPQRIWAGGTTRAPHAPYSTNTRSRIKAMETCQDPLKRKHQVSLGRNMDLDGNCPPPGRMTARITLFCFLP